MSKLQLFSRRWWPFLVLPVVGLAAAYPYRPTWKGLLALPLIAVGYAVIEGIYGWLLDDPAPGTLFPLLALSKVALWFGVSGCLIWAYVAAPDLGLFVRW